MVAMRGRGGGDDRSPGAQVCCGQEGRRGKMKAGRLEGGWLQEKTSGQGKVGKVCDQADGQAGAG